MASVWMEGLFGSGPDSLSWSPCPRGAWLGQSPRAASSPGGRGVRLPLPFCHQRPFPGPWAELSSPSAQRCLSTLNTALRGAPREDPAGSHSQSGVGRNVWFSADRAWAQLPARPECGW